MQGFLTRNWIVLLYAALILASVILAPVEPVEFIYTEF